MGAQIRSSLWSTLVLVLLCAAPLAAQTGAITGRVTDATTGAALPGAQVSLLNNAGQSSASALSDADGQFRLANLPGGSYTLVVALIGYENRRIEGVQVVPGQTSMQAVSLEPAAFELNPIIVSASRRQEKVIDAPASVAVVDSRAIADRPTTTPVDHLRSVPGVDVMTSGVQSTNVVVRGFNNVFSGALHALTDNRIAGVPSLRLNALHFIPSNDEDIERMEVVLGPGAALYGPNTSNGVLHIVTKSPIDAPGSTFSIAGGGQNLMQGQFRTALRLGDRLGFKLSGQYMRAKEWEYSDPVEQAERAKFAASSFFKQDLMNATGINDAEADRRIARIGHRDNDLSRFGFEGRFDWRPSGNSSIVLSGGSNLANGIELTGLGAAQAVDWRSSYVQARGNWNRLFVQGYVNMSDAGDTYLLRNGTPIVDHSKLYVGQIQHGFSLGERQSFTYGMDLLYTDPVTDGSINGKYEEDDHTTEFGAYLQSETMLHSKLNLVLAGRMDNHSALPENIFSPRAALVFKPTESQAFRLTFNRAFSTPSSLNQFLDLGSALPNEALARLGYSVRVQGTGTGGFRFLQNGGYQMRSPFNRATGQPADLMAVNAVNALHMAANALFAQGAINAALRDYLHSLQPGTADIGLSYLDLNHPDAGPQALSGLQLGDIAPIRESTTTTYEAGYKGLIGERLLISGDVYYSQIKDFVTPLTTSTPLILLDGTSTVAYMMPRLVPLFMSQGMSQAEAQQTAGALVAGMASVPVGVISSGDISANGGQVLATYFNVNEQINLWGADLSAMALLTETLSLTGTMSMVNKDQFETKEGTSVTLNAPKFKGSLALGFRSDDGLFSSEVRTRFNEGFPVRSGVYQGTICLGESRADGADDCVKSSTIVDLTLGYRLPIQGASLQVSMQNLFNSRYRSFPGVPTVGRMSLFRVKYDF
jgi:iron complex outermembrane receptor protein